MDETTRREHMTKQSTDQTKKLDIEALTAVASSIRLLTADAVERSTTGHPGMAMGMADLGAVLYGEILKAYCREPDWLDRDRFVLSAGHGALLLYSLLHLAGYGLPKEELMRFRRVGSLTPGHPERGRTVGVETTSGPLGAGFATAVGMALAERILAHRFNTADRRIIDHHTFVLSGDGCMMEGVTAEAASLAGHQRLGKLIAFYDSNDITIEGSTAITFTEDVRARFRAYGWQTLQGSGHDFAEILSLVQEAKRETGRPTLIELKSVIGRGAPNLQGKHKIHGAPLGMEELIATRRNLGAPEDEAFYVHPRAYTYFEEKAETGRRRWEQWQRLFAAWSEANPEKRRELDVFLEGGRAFAERVELPTFQVGEKLSTRDISGKALQAYAQAVPNLIGGAADLGPTVRTELQGWGDLTAENLEGRTIRFGVREHAMGSIVNGLALHGGFRAYCSTILIFADYMRPPIRLAALMKLPVIYIFTHDSVFLGGDGPTHQPVEQLTSLRIIPGFVLLRPGDAEEAVEAWRTAMERTDGPTAIAFSRQPIEVYPKDDPDWRRTVRRGAYCVKEPGGAPDVVVAASGSEVEMAVRAARLIEERAGQRPGGAPKPRIRIVSVMSRETFLGQDRAFREELIPPGVRTIAVEAGVRCGWEAVATSAEDIMSIDRFGVSGPYQEVAAHLGYTPEALADLVMRE